MQEKVLIMWDFFLDYAVKMAKLCTEHGKLCGKNMQDVVKSPGKISKAKKVLSCNNVVTVHSI